jgi:hypothetical protein
VSVVAVRVPGKIIFLHAFSQLRRFLFELKRRFQPMTAGRDSVHSFLVERVRQNIGAWDTIAGFRQQTLNAARGVKAKLRAVRAPEDLIDSCLQCGIHRVFGFFNNGIEHNEPAAALQHSHHLFNDA